MKSNKIRTDLVCIVLGVLLMGCSTRLSDFTVISTKGVSLDEVDLDSLPQTTGVTGKDSRFFILFPPFPTGYPQLQNAIDDALEKGGGDVMTDGVMHRRVWWFIIGQTALEVKGTVVKTRGTSQ